MNVRSNHARAAVSAFLISSALLFTQCSLRCHWCAGCRRRLISRFEQHRKSRALIVVAFEQSTDRSKESGSIDSYQLYAIPDIEGKARVGQPSHHCGQANEALADLRSGSLQGEIVLLPRGRSCGRRCSDQGANPVKRGSGRPCCIDGRPVQIAHLISFLLLGHSSIDI